MEEMYNEKLVKNLGLSNFSPEQVVDVYSSATIKPSVIQFESHPYLNRTEVIEFLQSLGIIVTAHSLLGSGDRPDGVKSGVEPEVTLLNHPVVNKIALEHHVTPAQVLIRYQIQRKCCAIPKSVNIDRIKSNINVFHFQLTQSNIEQLKGLENGFHYN